MDLERTSNCASPYATLDTCADHGADVCNVVVFAERHELSHVNVACVTYLYKYISKPHCVISDRLHCPAKWHAQARMLSHALPTDVVRVIGGHVREHAAIMLQKWMRGAAVRLAWGLPCLCDMDGNLVYM